jgi:hypothetical protein
MTGGADKKWNEQYQKLVEFQGKNGHCLVPRRYQEDVSLADWVATQRGRHAKTTIPLDREVLLNEIGFVWRVPNSAPSWQQQYEKLVEFKQKKGHCIVPAKYQEDASLGHWVSKQRQVHAKNNMPQEREALLNEIDFVWKAETGGRAAARSSTTNVSGLVSLHHLSRLTQDIFLTLVLVLLLTCVLGIAVGFRSDHHQCGTSK